METRRPNNKALGNGGSFYPFSAGEMSARKSLWAQTTAHSVGQVLVSAGGAETVSAEADKFVAFAASKSNPEAGLKLGDLLFVERIAAAVSKDNAALADAYNKALVEALADGSYAAVSRKYFNEDVRCK